MATEDEIFEYIPPSAAAPEDAAPILNEGARRRCAAARD